MMLLLQTEQILLLHLVFWDQADVLKTKAGGLDTHRETVWLFSHYVKLE